MISIIICSRTPDISAELRENIELTVGIDHEIVVVDNSASSYSIFSAYNAGVTRSSGDILCFMHDDVRMVETNWGSKVLCHFDDGNVGLIAIAGGKYLPSFPCYWFNSTNDRYINIIQHSQIDGSTVHDYVNPESVDSTDVVSVDGVWFCIRRTLFDRISFDEATYSGFHIYDLDICMQILACGSRCKVVYDILLEHLSIGNGGQLWMDAALLFVDKWKKALPAFSTDFRWTTFRKKNCWRAFADSLERMQRFGYDNKFVKRLIFSAIPQMPFTLSRNMVRVFRALL